MPTPRSITTTTIGSNHYALVASFDDEGVQIIDITDPASPSAVAGITDGSIYPELDGATSITTTKIGSNHYALVASFDDDGVQIINITNPASPIAVANITDSTTANPTDYPELDGAISITTTTIGSNHYALVASQNDDGVQIIDITDPASPSAVANITDSTATNPTDYLELRGATSITTTKIGSNHYALVASLGDGGVQIINITAPSSPSAVADITDGAIDENGDTFNVLRGATSITTTKIGSNHYAMVTSIYDSGVQIINITNPSIPTAVADITDGSTYSVLENAYSVTTTMIGSNHYALVTSFSDDGVQIINITDPSTPSAVAGITDGTDYPTLDGAYSVTTTTIGSNHYALVASSEGDGVQIIDITDPASPSAVADIIDDYISELEGAISITTTTIGSNHYALAASFLDDGVQIIDITDPSTPSAVAGITDGTDYPRLKAPTLLPPP